MACCTRGAVLLEDVVSCLRAGYELLTELSARCGAVRCGACSHGYGVTGRGVGVTIHPMSQTMRHSLSISPDNEQQRLWTMPRTATREKKKKSVRLYSLAAARKNLSRFRQTQITPPPPTLQPRNRETLRTGLSGFCFHIFPFLVTFISTERGKFFFSWFWHDQLTTYSYLTTR